MDGSVGSRAAYRGPRRVERAPEASLVSRIPVSVITLIVAIGVFVSCMGYAAGLAGDLKEGVGMGAEAIDSGQAAATLAKLQQFGKKHGEA